MDCQFQKTIARNVRSGLHFKNGYGYVQDPVGIRLSSLQNVVSLLVENHEILRRRPTAPDPEPTVTASSSKVRKVFYSGHLVGKKSSQSKALCNEVIDLQYYYIIYGQENLWSFNKSMAYKKMARFIINNNTDRWVC